MLLPLSTQVNKDGRISVGQCDVKELKIKYGTPLYIVDVATLKKQLQDYNKFFSFAGYETELVYASKAFNTTAMCQMVRQEGFSIDVSTGGELYIALKSGFEPQKILFHGNNKSLSEMEFGADSRVGKFMVDNFNELEMLDKIAGQKGLKQDIMLRINPGIEAHTHKYIQTGTIESKFGFGIYGGLAMEAVGRALGHKNLKLVGLHAHIGSQIFNIEVYGKLIETMLNLIREVKEKYGFEIRDLNIGGGLGIRYIPSDNPAGIKEYAGLVNEALEKYTRKYQVSIKKIMLEPGRSLVGNAGCTLYEAGNIKSIPGRKTYLAIDGGMSDNIRPMLYQARYCAVLASRASYIGHLIQGDLDPALFHPESRTQGKNNFIKYSLVGKHCESGDVIIDEIMLPQVQTGDLILVAATGAYCYSMSSNYNGQPRSAVVAVEDGKSCLWVERQEFQDLISRDRVYTGC